MSTTQSEAAFHIYMIECSDGGIYTGIAKDPAARFEQHKSGRGAKYFRTCKPIKIIMQTSRAFNRSRAQSIERTIKSMSHASKLDYAQHIQRLQNKERKAKTIHEVWSEGFRATGEEHGTANKLGEAEASTFEEACDIVCGKLKDYNPKRGTFWGCRLFDNEADARKSFG